MKGDKTTAMDKEIVMPGGTKVMPDGTMMVKMKDGTIMNMKGQLLGKTAK